MKEVRGTRLPAEIADRNSVHLMGPQDRGGQGVMSSPLREPDAEVRKVTDLGVEHRLRLAPWPQFGVRTDSVVQLGALHLDSLSLDVPSSAEVQASALC